MISLQKPTGSVVVGAASAKKGARTAGLNLEQCIVIRFINKVVVLSQGSSANNEIKKWYELLKYFGVLQNMRCQYDDGALIGKGNFAMVFEATHQATGRKFALKTINKQMYEDNVKSALGLHDEVSLLRKIRHPNVL